MKLTKILLCICMAVLGLLSCDSQTKKKEASGLFSVRQNGKYGFIDKTGKIVIKPQFDKAYPFHDGLALVIINNKHGFIDKKGKLVISIIAGATTTALANGGGIGIPRRAGLTCCGPRSQALRSVDHHHAL